MGVGGVLSEGVAGNLAILSMDGAPPSPSGMSTGQGKDHAQLVRQRGAVDSLMKWLVVLSM